MKIGLSVQIAWPLAGEEAGAGLAGEIEPGHMICALLKLSEIPSSAFSNALPDKKLQGALDAEINNLRESLENLGIAVPNDSRPLRRELRSLLKQDRKAGAGPAGGVMHRSRETKAAFERASKKNKIVDACALFNALLENPDDNLSMALAQMGEGVLNVKIAGVEKVAEWIEKFGRDLTAMASNNKPDDNTLAGIRRDAVCRVLADSLFAGHASERPLLLVSKGERRPDVVMSDLAAWIASNDPPKNARRGRVIEIDSASLLSQEGDEKGASSRRLGELFDQAKAWRKTVLFFDNFHRYLNPEIAGGKTARRLQALLKQGNCTCVMGMNKEQYEASVERDPDWGKIFQIVWIHETGKAKFEL